MSGHEIEVSREIQASAEGVWAVITDIPGAARVLRGVSRIEMLTDGPYDVGTRWLETRRMMGREETQDMVVAECNVPVQTRVTATDGGVNYSSTLRVEPLGEARCRLSMSFGAQHPGASPFARLLWTVFGPLGARFARHRMAADLDDIAAAAESA